MTLAHNLRTIVSAVREDLTERKAAVPFPEIAALAKENRRRGNIRDFLGEGPGIIAEIKRASQ